MGQWLKDVTKGSAEAEIARLSEGNTAQEDKENATIFQVRVSGIECGSY